MKINVTSGECLNDILKQKYPDKNFIPFNEAMIKGGYSSPLFSDAFIRERAAAHGVSEEEYREKLSPFLKLLKNVRDYDGIDLWFGDEPFCRRNTETVIAALKEYGYGGTIILHIVNEESGEELSRTNKQVL